MCRIHQVAVRMAADRTEVRMEALAAPVYQHTISPVLTGIGNIM